MNKKINKQTIKLLSGVLMSGFTISLVESNTFANESIVAEATVENRAVTKTGVVTATALHVRKTSSASSASLGGLSKGDNVKIVETTSNGWYKIIYKSGYGYVSNKYVNIVSTSSSSSSSSAPTSSSTTVTYTGVTTDGLNIRSGSSISYSKVGYFAKGTKIDIVAKLSNGWYKVKISSSKYGYVCGDYVKNVTAVSSNSSSSSSSSSNTSSSTTVKYTATVSVSDFLNVRSGGSTSYSVLGKIYNGDKVQIVDKMSNGWSKIKYNSGYGYVNTSYLNNITSSSSSSSATVLKTGTVNTTTLNVRSGASTSYSKIGTVSRGAKVDIVEISNGWYKIKFNNGYGYVSSDYVTIPGERSNLNNFLFIGDSFTALLKSTIVAKNDNVYVQAKSGSMPSYWLNKVSSMPTNSKVDGVVLLIGVNGAGYESNKTDVKTLINKLSARYPNKTIYVQKIFPVGRNFTSANPYSFNQKIKSLNSVIESHCKTVSNAKFIDTTSGFVDNNGYLTHTYDGLHISSSYNTKFYNNILNAVKSAEK